MKFSQMRKMREEILSKTITIDQRFRTSKKIKTKFFQFIHSSNQSFDKTIIRDEINHSTTLTNHVTEISQTSTSNIHRHFITNILISTRRPINTREETDTVILSRSRVIKSIHATVYDCTRSTIQTYPTVFRRNTWLRIMIVSLRVVYESIQSQYGAM